MAAVVATLDRCRIHLLLPFTLVLSGWRPAFLPTLDGFYHYPYYLPTYYVRSSLPTTTYLPVPVHCRDHRVLLLTGRKGLRCCHTFLRSCCVVNLPSYHRCHFACAAISSPGSPAVLQLRYHAIVLHNLTPDWLPALLPVPHLPFVHYCTCRCFTKFFMPPCRLPRFNTYSMRLVSATTPAFVRQERKSCLRFSYHLAYLSPSPIRYYLVVVWRRHGFTTTLPFIFDTATVLQRLLVLLRFCVHFQFLPTSSFTPQLLSTVRILPAITVLPFYYHRQAYMLVFYHGLHTVWFVSDWR